MDDNVQFDSEQGYASQPTTQQGPKGLTRLVMRWGIAKDEKTAQYVLLGIAAVAIVLAFLLPVIFGHHAVSAPQSQINAAMQQS